MATKKAAASDSGNPNLLSTLFAEKTQSGRGAMGGAHMFHLKEVDLPMPAVGEFPEAFTLTIRELTSSQEIKVIESSSTQSGIGMAMAKASMKAVNGEEITLKTRDFVWEALGAKGRQLVVLGLNAGLNDDVDAEELERFLDAVKPS